MRRANPEQMAKFGLTPESTPDDKVAKFKAACMDAGDDEIKAMAASLDEHPEHEGAKALSAKLKKFGAEAPAPTAMAAETEEKKEKEEEEKAMSALSASLSAKGVTVPAGATRAVLMSLAAMGSAPPDLAAVKAQIKAELRAEDAAEAEKAERSHLVTMASTAKAPEYEIAALGVLPLATARDMAKAKWGVNATGAPAHLFARHTASGAPIGEGPGAGVRGAREGAPIASATTVKAKNGMTVVTDDAGIADKAMEFAASKDPVIMSRIDAALAPSERADRFRRYMAAERLAAELHPDLVPAAG